MCHRWCTYSRSAVEVALSSLFANGQSCTRCFARFSFSGIRVRGATEPYLVHGSSRRCRTQLRVLACHHHSPDHSRCNHETGHTDRGGSAPMRSPWALRNPGEPFVCTNGRVLEFPCILTRRGRAIPFNLPGEAAHQRPSDYSHCAACKFGIPSRCFFESTGVQFRIDFGRLHVCMVLIHAYRVLPRLHVVG